MPEPGGCVECLGPVDPGTYYLRCLIWGVRGSTVVSGVGGQE